jgi:Lrp/AsnC family transcriptional regulator for asnA, asnC and gidA
MVKIPEDGKVQNRRRRSRKLASERPPIRGADPELDATDRRIIQVLQRNGRQSNAEISRVLGIGESSVRRRIDYLIENDVIQVVAVAEPLRVGYSIYALIGLTTSSGKTLAVSQKLREFREVTWLAVVAGRYDVMFAAVFEGPNELLRFLTVALGELPGIERSETFYILDMVKRAFDWRLPGMPGDGRLPGSPRVRRGGR